MSSSAKPNLCVGLDVHKDSFSIAVLRNPDSEPIRVDRPPNHHKKLRWYFERLGAEGSVRSCYEASGAGIRARASDNRMGLPV